MHLAHLVTVPVSAHLLLGVELDYLVSKGHRVSVITGPGHRMDQLVNAHPEVELVVIPALTRRMDPVSDLHASRQLFACLRRIRPDVLHTHMPKTGWIGRIVGRVAGVPCVVNTCHGLYARQPSSRMGRFIAMVVEWLSESFAHHNLFQNHDDLASMHRWAPWRDHTYIGNGIDPSKFLPEAVDKQQARQDLGLSEDALIVGSVGRLIEHKGVREFALAANRLSGQADFVWVGPEEPDKATASEPPDGGVIYLGEQTNMPQVYAAMDVFVLASYMEGVPRSAMEAAATGLPLILTDIPGSRDLGHHGTELLLVPARDASALTQAIESLIADAPLRDRLGSNGRQRIIERHDQRQIAQALLKLYEDCHAGKRSAR